MNIDNLPPHVQAMLANDPELRAIFADKQATSSTEADVRLTVMTRAFLVQLYDARRRSGLTQTDVAARVSITRATLSRIERGKASPRLETLLKIADAVGASLQMQYKA